MIAGVCEDCNDKFDMESFGSWREVTGWVEVRPVQGSKANSVHKKEFTGRGLCARCAKNRELNVHVNQGVMF